MGEQVFYFDFVSPYSYLAQTQLALKLGMFAVSAFEVDGQVFFGQDRLQFVEKTLCSEPVAN